MRRQYTFVVLACLLFAGCKQAALVPQAVAEPVVVDAPQPTPAPIPPPASARDLMLQQLIEQADQALARGRLTEPDFDNAYDKFLAATLVDPTNAAAKSGLSAVMLSLVGITREHITRGELREAQKSLNTILKLFPASEYSQELKDELKKAVQRRYQASEMAQSAIAKDPRKHLIPLKFLSAESDESKKWFALMAENIKKEDASILIHARSDAEGRKVYRLLRAAVSDYLLRGDIRISNPPLIQLLEPLP